MWDKTIHSIKHAESEPKGGGEPCGCVLAHCMGLGKTLQVTFILSMPHLSVLISLSLSLSLSLCMCVVVYECNWPILPLRHATFS